jgi:uncharacterized membrane protein
VKTTEKKAMGVLEVEATAAFPSPSVLAEYTAIDRSFVEKLLSAVEREQLHRHWRDRASEWTARLGVICGLVIGLAGLTTAAYMAWIGSAIPGAAIGTADLLGLVGVFIYGSRHQVVAGRVIPSAHTESRPPPDRTSRRAAGKDEQPS